MAKWIEAARAEELPPGEKTCIDASGFPVVLCNVAGRFFAAVNICPHAGLPIGDGDLAGMTLTCPYHGYTYSVETGKNVDDPSDMPLTTFPIRVVDGKIEVELPIKA
jgi:3-phenylpropionate/trans-cinnamate dioxygenase ferredoxin subunit